MNIAATMPRLAEAAAIRPPVVDRGFEARLEKGDISLPSLLLSRAARDPNRLALRRKERGIWRRYSWGEYAERVRKVAMGLRALGIGRGDFVAVASENVPEWFFADFGSQSLGAIVVGIYPTNPWPEMQYILRHCGARVVFAGDQEQADKVVEARRREGGLPGLEHIIVFDTKGMRGYSEPGLISFDDLLKLGEGATQAEFESLVAEIEPDETCILVYTSGTTGAPKGAMVSHRNLVFNAYATATAAELFGRPYENLSFLPLSHIADRYCSPVMQMVLGGVIDFAESIDTVSSNVRELSPTIFISVPRIYEKMQQAFLFKLDESGWLQRKLFALAMSSGKALSDARQAGKGTAIGRLKEQVLHWLMFRNAQRFMGLHRTHWRLCSAAAISPEVLRFFDIIGIPLTQAYGSTESTGLALIQRGGAKRIGTVGRAVPGIEWKTADDGELLLRGPGVFKGYYRDPEASQRTVDQDGWLATGDIVSVDDYGEISIIDRKKAIIITSGGKNIAPSEIENALRDSVYVREAIVVGDGRNFLGALIQIDFDNVGRWAREHNIPYTTYNSLAVHPDVRELVQGVVNEVNGRFARVENIRKFVILEKELDHDDGELTATQKVRRGMIEKKFARELTMIYGS